MRDRSRDPAPAPPRLAGAVARLGTESAFAVLTRARRLEARGRSVVHLEIGEPRFPTPAHVGEAAVAAIRAGETGYCPPAGLPELRAAAARSLGAGRGIDVAPERVLIGTGAKPFLLFTVLATCEPGDEVLLPDPGFPIYASAVAWAGATAVPYTGPEALAAGIGPRTKLVILNSPNNPTGAVLSAAELAAVAERVRESGAWVLSDEVYWRLLHDADHASIADPARDARAHRPARQPLQDLRDDRLALRVRVRARAAGGPAGALLRERHVVRAAVRAARGDRRAGGPPGRRRGDGGRAAGAAGPPRRRARRAARVSCATPQGAFYAFPDVTGVGIGADTLADRLLEEAGVAVLAGGAFGAAGAGNLRLSYGTDRADLEAGLERMGSLLAAL